MYELIILGWIQQRVDLPHNPTEQSTIQGLCQSISAVARLVYIL